MDKSALVQAFTEFKDFKNIDRPKMMKVLDEVFRNMLKRKYGTDENFDVIINTDKGDIEIYWNRTVVENGQVEDPILQISYDDANKNDEGFDVGEEYSEQLDITMFERRSVVNAIQNFKTRVMELDKEEVLQKYKDREGEIISSEVYQVTRREVILLDDEGNELILPRNEQIPADFYKKGDSIRAVVLKVEYRNNSPFILLSRTAPLFLQRLFEVEVPEIADGLITIRNIVREPGERAKVAVESYDDRIDPVGACVGMRGSRIHGIVRELRNENIDVINYTPNRQLYISRSLSPARITSMEVDEEKMRASVYLKPDQVSLAIGRAGLNIKLASRLTGFEIDVYRDVEEQEYDIELEEFADEIDGWMIEELKNIGLDTAKNVLALSAEDLVRRTELEEETVKHILGILRAEFEK